MTLWILKGVESTVFAGLYRIPIMKHLEELCFAVYESGLPATTLYTWICNSLKGTSYSEADRSSNTDKPTATVIAYACGLRSHHHSAEHMY